MPFGLQPLHLILIALLALLIFGPPYLPAIGRRLGRWLGVLRNGRPPGGQRQQGYLVGGSTASQLASGKGSSRSPVCTLCGTNNPSGAVYCRQCGIRLEG